MPLRLLLFGGLLLHKLIWEIWKRKYPSAQQVQLKPRNPLQIVLKLIKIALLIFFLVQTLFLDVLPIKDPPSFVRNLGLILFVLGLCMSISARIHLGPNWRNVEDLQLAEKHLLVTNGIYRFVRHPIYAGDLLLVIGLQLALQSWLFLLGLLIAVVIVRQAIAEEKLLLTKFPEYHDYCVRTKRFLPFLI
ncbi:isoprenylcysteine carboxylmethyltransferase family protein [bacterium]|nr:isoprenylcysteine carboxylmethyltransferase family protein [bacterium]MCI0607085.1 isoprenylcysteine carboxylmethyltransferase family protein [bacterium]